MPHSCGRASYKRPILDSLGEVRHSQTIRAFKVGNSARQLEDAVVGAGGHDAGANLRRTFRGCSATKSLVLHRRHFNMDVDAIERRT